MARTVALTGLSHAWGSPLVRALAHDDRAERLLALGEDGGPGVEALDVDAEDPGLPEALEAAGVDVVVHADVAGRRHADEARYQRALLRTTHLLSAAAAAGARRIVVLSSLRAYGALPEHASRVDERTPPRAGHRATQDNRPWVELERRLSTLVDDWPETDWLVLRPAHLLGRDTPMARMLARPWTPVLLGFDPLLQLTDARDLGAALSAAALGDAAPGAYNIAPDDALPLSQILRRAGVVPLPVPHPAVYAMAHAAYALGEEVSEPGAPGFGQRLGGLALGPLPLPPDWLRYGCVLDARQARDWCPPPRPSATALAEFLGARRDGEAA